MSRSLNYMTDRYTAVLDTVINEARAKRKFEPLDALYPPVDAGGFSNFNPTTKKVTVIGIQMKGRAARNTFQGTEYPLADVTQSTMEKETEQYILGARYDEEEILSAMEGQRNPPQEHMEAAYLGVLDAHDERVFADFANDSNVPTSSDFALPISTATQEGESGRAASADEAYAAVTGFIDEMDEGTDGVFQTTHVLMPSSPYNNLANLTSNNTDRSLLERIRSAKGVEIIKVPALKEYGTGRMVAVDAMQPRSGMNMFMWLQQRPPYALATGQVDVVFRARGAGFMRPIPLAYRYKDNAGA